MASHSYFDNPEFFKLYRSTLFPIGEERFKALFGLVEKVVMSDPTPFYEKTHVEGAGQTTIPTHANIIALGEEVLVQIDGPTRTPKSHLMDARLFTEHARSERAVGIVAFIGIDWKPSVPFGTLEIDPNNLTKPVQLTPPDGVADGRIDTLWVMSTDGQSSHWVTGYDDGRAITEYEYEQLVTDLSHSSE